MKRYNLDTNGSSDAIMEIEEDGEWVRFDDVHSPQAATEAGSAEFELLCLRQLMSDIHSRATRKNRACSEPEYLGWDLEFIAERAREAMKKLDKLSAT